LWRDYQFQDTSYLGIDVVEGLSTTNNRLYGNQNTKFLEVSGSDILPKAELLICKDVLQHLKNSDISSLLSQLQKFKFVVICNDIHLDIPVWRKVRFFLQPRARLRKFMLLQSPFYLVNILPNNSEIGTGEYRGIDLETPIFYNFFKEFNLLERIDFKAEHLQGTVKRILFFQRITE
jgi:hypothetical protein